MYSRSGLVATLTARAGPVLLDPHSGDRFEKCALEKPDPRAQSHDFFGGSLARVGSRASNDRGKEIEMHVNGLNRPIFTGKSALFFLIIASTHLAPALGQVSPG